MYNVHFTIVLRVGGIFGSSVKRERKPLENEQDQTVHICYNNKGEIVRSCKRRQLAVRK